MPPPRNCHPERAKTLGPRTHDHLPPTSPRRDQPRHLGPRLGPGTHHQHGRHPPRLVHLPPAHLGRPHRRLPLPQVRRARSKTPPINKSIVDLFTQRIRRRLVLREHPRKAPPRRHRLPPCGHTRVPQGDGHPRRLVRVRSQLPRRPRLRPRHPADAATIQTRAPTSTPRAATSTAAGSCLPCSAPSACTTARPSRPSPPTAGPSTKRAAPSPNPSATSSIPSPSWTSSAATSSASGSPPSTSAKTSSPPCPCSSASPKRSTASSATPSASSSAPSPKPTPPPAKSTPSTPAHRRRRRRRSVRQKQPIDQYILAKTAELTPRSPRLRRLRVPPRLPPAQRVL